jgi:hypothetical protein
MDLIAVEELINILKENNINLGKGDPYNRLRYYTKIGLIPHMIRKKNSNNTNSGHYPKEVVKKIIDIEKMKMEGLSNEDIILKIKSKKDNPVPSFLEIIKNKFSINYLFVFLFIIGIIFEVFRFNSRQETPQFIPNNNLNKEISNTNLSFIPAGQKKVFIASNDVNQKSVILISFRDNIFPATNYFISEVKDGLGFFVETNVEVSKEVKFTWATIN